MPSDSVSETVVLANQLNAFAEAQRLREEVQARDLRIADLEKQVTDLKKQLGEDAMPARPMLQCLCCDADMAPAKTFSNSHWEWEDGDKATCDSCGWEGRVTADDGRCAVMEELGEEELEECSESGEEDEEF